MDYYKTMNKNKVWINTTIHCNIVTVNKPYLQFGCLKGTRWAFFGGKTTHSTQSCKGKYIPPGFEPPDRWVTGRTLYHWAIWLADDWA